MNKARILQLTQQKADNAIYVAALTANSLITPFIPVNLGTLRRDREIRKIAPGVVHIVQSPKGSASEKYAATQYFDYLRHRTDSAGYADLAQSVPLGAGGKKQAGRGNKYLYGRAYRIAVKNDSLSRSKPEWFRRFLNTPSMVQEVITVAVNRWRR